MGKREELNLFLERADELISSKYILADIKIVNILKAIAGSETLIALFKSCLANFDYEDAKKKEALDLDVEELIKREENFFTTVAQFGIFKTILELNTELQKELQETQGKGSPTINFTVEELKKLVGILNFTKQHYSVGNTDIASLYESIMLTLKFLDGSIKSTDPKEIQVKVNETIKVCMDTLKTYDFAWQELFKKVIADVNKTQEEMRNAQQPKN